MKITITGSLGHISKPLAQQLVQQKQQVAVVTSNHDRVQAIEQLGATAKVGRVDDVNFLTDAFKGADAVYCMVPPNFAHPDQITYYREVTTNYATAIKRSGVKRVVYLSSYGAHLPSGTGFITGSYQSEQILNGIPDINVTHLRPTFFYYNLLGFIDMIKTAGFIGAVYGGDDKLPMVAPTDIAAAAAEELLAETNFKPFRYVCSDERTCNETAQILGNAIGIPGLQWIALPKDQVLKALIQQGIPENAAANLVELGEALHTGKLRTDFDLHKPAFAKVKLEDYAKEFAKAFAAK